MGEQKRDDDPRRLTERLMGHVRSARATRGSGEASVIGDPARLAALHRTALLDTPAEEAFDRLTRIAARVLDAPVALLTLVGEERQFCMSMVGLPEIWTSGRDAPLAYSFCQHAVVSGMPLVIEDAREHPLVRRDPATLRGVIAYAGAPLVTSDGHALGTLCAIDFEPRAWSSHEVDVLVELAGAVITRIELRAVLRETQEAAWAADRAREALRESEERFRTAFEAAPIGMALLATDGRWIRVNQSLCEIVGYTREELLATSSQAITHPDDVALGLEKVGQLLAGDTQGYAMEKRYIHRDGREVWILVNVSLVRDAKGEPFHLIAQIQDITARKHEEDRLRNLSFLDPLTGLYNRRAFATMAGDQMKLARRQEHGLLLIFSDIDKMKRINDSFGHAEGDRAIVRMANLLRRTFRESDLIARMGGDEFAVLAHVAEGNEAAVMERFRAWLRTAAVQEGASRGYTLSMSLGAAYYDPADPCSLDELIDRADAQMYVEKGRDLAS